MDLKQYIKDGPGPVKKRWALIKNTMSTHLHGMPPEWLFRTRRPLESTNDYALTYRLENFQPITLQPFKTAVDSIVETAEHIYVSVDGVDDNTATYLDDLTLVVAGKSYNLKDYVIKYISRQVEFDPNAVLVVYPIHPTEELVADYREELPNFNSIQNQFVDLGIELIPSERINKISDEMLVFEVGEWIYDIQKDKPMTEPYYMMLTAEMTSLIIPVKRKNGYEYEAVDYYFNDLGYIPFDVIGANAIFEEVDDEMVHYMQSTYAGAVAIANECLGIKSDEQICTTRFTYPEKFMQMERCGHPGCIECRDPDSPYAGIFVNYASDGTCSTCSTCSGTGKVSPDSSPLGTHWISKSDLFSDDGKFVPPVHFVTPPLESPQYLAGQVREYFTQMERALFIMNQNMTNQSGESKSYDIRQKVTVISNAVRNIYSILENTMNTIQGYFRGEQDIIIQMPPDFNIKTSEDITVELGEARNTSSIYTSELTRELLLKKFGATDATRRIVDVLELEDKLFGMTVQEILQLKAVYGNALTARDQIVHDKGFTVLKRLAQAEDFLTISDEVLMERFNAEIDRIAPIVNPSPIA